MFENLSNTSVNVASEEDLLAAMGEAPKEGKTPGKKDTKVKTTDDKSKGKQPVETVKEVKPLSKSNLDLALGGDEDNEDEDNEGDNEDVVKKKVAPTKKKVETKKEKSDDDDTSDDDDSVDDDNENENENDENESDEDESNEDDEKKEEDNEENKGSIEVKDFLKARVEFLIKKGEWVDFEGREETEWDEDEFAKVELQQREFQKGKLKEELLDEFGPYGREIAEYSSKGGDPEKLIDIFKEQQIVENLSIADADSQKEVVLKFATEFQNMTPKRAKTYVDTLIANNELEDAAKEAKTQMETLLVEREEELKAEQDQIVKDNETKQKAIRDTFAKNVNTVLSSREDISADEKKELIKVLTKFDKKLSNGTPVNDFYFKLAEFRKDLPNYIELVRLVLNPKKYIKSGKIKGSNERAEKDFSLIRTHNAAKKSKSTGNPAAADTGKKSTFKLLY